MNTIDNDKIIANYLGWFEDGLPGTYYINDGTAIRVVYSVHNNYPYQNLPFSRDWNWMMHVLEKINERHNAGIKARDLTYTIKYLLGGGYFPNSDVQLPKVTMTLENLYERVVAYLTNI